MKILIAIDGSPSSEAAVAEVAQRPWPESTEVRIVTVDAAVNQGIPKQITTSAFDELVRQQQAESQKRLRDAAAVLARGASKLRVSTLLLEGHAREAIVNEAQNWGANLIVVGSQGDSPIRRFFLGSVSQYVAQNAPCSVQIVRSPAS